jgi:hypothetical protein
MITIKFAGTKCAPGLQRSAENAAWLASPTGMAARCGSGPNGAICRDCLHLDLVRSRWSDKGRAAVCTERERLTGQAAQEVPLNTAACSRYSGRPNTEAALVAADRHFDGQLAEKRDRISHLEGMIRRLNEECRELLLQRSHKPEPVDAGDGQRPFAPLEGEMERE